MRQSAPRQSDVKEALIQSFRAGRRTVEALPRQSLSLSDQPRDNGSWETNRQDATEATIRLGLSQRHADVSSAKIRRVTFDTPSGRSSPSPPGVAERDVDVDMIAAQNTPAGRAPSFEVVTETEYQASLQHPSNGKTFKKEVTENDDNIGPCVDN
ncbi:hypothetical protein C0992_012366, partial [Termitomyces sp. T32_za158]